MLNFQTTSDEYCATIAFDADGMWKTESCNRLFPAICKKVAPGFTQPPVTTNFPVVPGANYGCKVENGWILGPTNYCYKYYQLLDEHKAFDEAKVACRQESAELVEILSETENEFVLSLLRSKRIDNDKENEKNKSLKADEAYKCPTTWTMGSNNKCYKVFKEMSTWDESQSVCVKNGGRLAKVFDENDNSFISNLSKISINIYFCSQKRTN